MPSWLAVFRSMVRLNFGAVLLGYPRLSPLEDFVHVRCGATPHTAPVRIYFILQLGYFKSHHLFFVFDLPEVKEDAQYIQAQYFPDFSLLSINGSHEVNFNTPLEYYPPWIDGEAQGL